MAEVDAEDYFNEGQAELGMLMQERARTELATAYETIISYRYYNGLTQV